MTAIEAFWQLLYSLQHTTTPCVDITAGGGWHVVYGGSALTSFLYAMESGGRWIFEFAPNVRF